MKKPEFKNQPKKDEVVDPAMMLGVLQRAGIDLFKERGGKPLNQAQRNLDGRTHYVEDSTIKSFVGQIHATHILDGGLLIGIVESVQAGPNAESGRVFRPVVFDLFGNVVYRPDIDESFQTLKLATMDFWDKADSFDAHKLTLEGLKAKVKEAESEVEMWKRLAEQFE